MLRAGIFALRSSFFVRLNSAFSDSFSRKAFLIRSVSSIRPSRSKYQHRANAATTISQIRSRVENRIPAILTAVECDHEAALALFFMHYNFCQRHGTLKTTPAVAAGLTQEKWTVAEMIERTANYVPPQTTLADRIEALPD